MITVMLCSLGYATVLHLRKIRGVIVKADVSYFPVVLNAITKKAARET